MKLVYRIVLHISWALSLLLAAWAVLFYVTIVDEINDETDDALENHAEAIIKQMLSGREVPGASCPRQPGASADEISAGVLGRRLPATAPGSNDGFFLTEICDEDAASRPHAVYTDEDVFIPARDEEEPARVLRRIFRDGEGRWFELTVMTPTFEKEELREAILQWIVMLYLFLLLTILAVNVLVLHRTLRPLRALLRWLDGYTVGGKNPPLESNTDITEFRRLNDAACRYAQRAESLFERQKQFIGNASHEMQTPLAVCRNRLEMLVDEGAALSEEQLVEIAKVQRTLDSLVRLNRSLLLLSKIDNGQFPETDEVDLNALAARTAEDMAEIYASRRVRFVQHDEGRLTARMNPSLAASLVGNLLKNACVHGDPGGEVVVTLTPRRLTVANDGAAGPLDAEHIFDRFYQGTKKEGSTGLGLSIVDAVCRLYGLSVEYAYGNGRHCFTVHFPG